MQLTQTHQSNPDYLRLYDGNSEEAILLGTLFGENIPSKIKSSGQRMFVTFTTDHYAVANGFSAIIIEEQWVVRKVGKLKNYLLNSIHHHGEFTAPFLP